MPKIISKLNTKSQDFLANAEHMQGQVSDLENKIAQIKLGGGEKANQRHLDRGKLLPRDRINGLLDPGSAFLELSQ